MTVVLNPLGIAMIVDCSNILCVCKYSTCRPVPVMNITYLTYYRGTLLYIYPNFELKGAGISLEASIMSTAKNRVQCKLISN